MRKQSGRQNCRVSITVGSDEWATFKRKAKWLSKMNRFSMEEWTLMEAWAMADILGARLRFDPKKGGSRQKYINTVICNALTKAAQKIADERAIWSKSRVSLDVAMGEGDGTMTPCDLIQSQATMNANEKLGTEPVQVRVRDRLNKYKREKDFAALERLRRRLQLESAADSLGDEADGDETFVSEEDPGGSETGGDDLLGDFPDAGEADPLELNARSYGMEQQHGEAVEEIGLADDPDERTETPDRENKMTGFGDCAEAVYQATLKIDVAIVMNGLEPKLKRFCRYVQNGYSVSGAYRACRFSKTNFHAYIRPALQEEFKHLRYAL